MKTQLRLLVILVAALTTTPIRGLAQQQKPAPADAAAAAGKPNILVIFGDDVGILNVSAYGRGVVGYTTPNIDRIASEGAIFTDYYGQQSCTAGRSAFITGQVPFRTGLSKVGLPGAPQGLQKEDPTIAELLKPLGYVTGQFGKNHLGDRDEFLPTAHGFDEFFGNLYHLNAEEEPENEDYPKNPEFRKKFGPRGVIKSSADGKIEDTGPLTKKRMETIDAEVLAATTDFIDRAKKAEQAVLRLVQHHPHAQLHPRAEGEPQDRARRVCRWHDRARRADRAASRPPRQSRAHRATRSSSTRATTVRWSASGRMPARRRSAARRTPTGRAAGACRR